MKGITMNLQVHESDPITGYTLYQYWITRPDGACYKGTAYGDDRDWTHDDWERFAYTHNGAAKKISLFPIPFSDCHIQRKP